MRTLTLAPGASPGGALRLHVVADDRVTVHDLPSRGTVTIGRAPTAHVRIEAAGVSRRHARLHLGPRLQLEDLDSHNGTILREHRLEAHRLVDLALGDVFEIGGALLLVQPLSSRTLETEPSRAPRRGSGPTGPGQAPIIEDGVMKRLHRLIERVGASDIPVLLLGETGVGKEVCARLVHDASTRRDGPFVAVNCAALPASLVESELFGHDRGAFSGAAGAKPGILESADGGTLLLDEVGELPTSVQAKLLRFLESGEARRLGAVRPRRLDVRVISATNRDLESEIAASNFRQDLYFRLNGFSLVIPPLRERLAEIEPLARHFAAQACTGRSDGPPPLTPGALDALRRHDWPGNIRELRRVIERALILSDGASIRADHLLFGTPQSVEEGAAAPPAPPPSPAPSRSRRRAAPEAERARILHALQQCGGNQTRAAKLLGVSRRTLVSRLSELGLPRPRKGPSPT